MKKVAFLLLFMLGVSILMLPLGCQPASPSPTPAPTVVAPVSTPTPSATPQPVTPTPVSPTPRPTPTPTATPATTPAPATPTPVVAPLSLVIDTPLTESIVFTNTVVVKGKTNLDAVVTVGNKNVDVDENGNFTANVQLTVGPNIIEVLATDLTGNTRGQVLTVIYAP